MSAAYTPGPWTADNEVVGWWGGEQPGCMVRFWHGDTGHPIANCLSRDTGIQHAEANARLIAAAPDLYEAVERLAPKIARILRNDWSRASDKELGDLFQAAQAALAKVRGEA